MFDFTNYSDLDALYMIDYINFSNYHPGGHHAGDTGLACLYKLFHIQ